MKCWKYKIANRVNFGTEENPVWHEAFFEKRLPYSEANEEIAKKEAWGGEYTVEDDGQPEPEAVTSQEERIAQLEEALELLLSGVTQ